MNDLIIVETSETESFSSEQCRRLSHEENEVSLDSLFGALANSSKKLQDTKEEDEEVEVDEVVEVEDSEDEDAQAKSKADIDFSRVKKLLEDMPKLESKFEAKLAKEALKPKKDVVLVNDPITAVRKSKTKAEETDSGAKWFHMKTQEMTPELKRDLMVIKNRSALDPKRHYKKDNWEIPKFFQMGTIIEGNTEFYSSRMKRKDRGTSLVDEILKDETANKYFKTKYEAIQEHNKSGGKEHYKQLREKRRRY